MRVKLRGFEVRPRALALALFLLGTLPGPSAALSQGPGVTVTVGPAHADVIGSAHFFRREAHDLARFTAVQQMRRLLAGICVYNEQVASKAPTLLPWQSKKGDGAFLNVRHRPWLVLLLLAALGSGASASHTPAASTDSDRKDLVSAVKRLEKKLGFRRTKNFHKRSGQSAVAYRCYYTGKLELPDSYEKLQLLQGTKAGCPVDAQKYDVFFYPLEASATGKAPVTAALAQESVERFLVVVPHEDFHANKEMRKLPASLSEGAATLIGFLTAAEVARQKYGKTSDVYQNLQREPKLFLRKAELVNRYHARLSQLYAAARAGQIAEPAALARKQQSFEEIEQACKAIQPAPTSFGACLSANNNAGLAFDETYAKYYPLMYDLYVAEGRELKPTVDALERALNTKSEAEALENLRKPAASGR